MKKPLILAMALFLFVGCNDKKESATKDEQGKELNTPKEEKVNRPAFSKNEEDAYTFQFNLKEGETYPMEIHSNTKNDQTDGKKGLSVSQESSSKLSYKVTSVKDSTFVLNVTFDYFSEKMSDGSQSLAFDTRKEAPTNEAAKQRWEFNKKLIGQSFGMEISSTGDILDVFGLWKLRKQIKEKAKAELSEDKSDELDVFLMDALADDAMVSMFEDAVSFYPKKAIKKGENWEVKEEAGSGKSNVTYTFEGVDKGLATIHVKGESSGKDSESNPQGVKMFRSLKGNVTGDVQLDAESGWMKNISVNKEEVVRMTQEYQGQKMNFSSTTKATTTIN